MDLRFLDWFGHASFLIKNEQHLYFDPWDLPDVSLPEADIVFITHDHPKHSSLPDVRRIAKIDTIVVGPKSCLRKFMLNQVPISPDQTKDVLGYSIRAVPAYDPDDGRAHPRSNNGLGYIVQVGQTSVYHAGDTGLIPEFDRVRADVALIPVGGEDTMDAADAAKRIKARITVPMHYDDTASGLEEVGKFMRFCTAADVPWEILQRTGRSKEP